MRRLLSNDDLGSFLRREGLHEIDLQSMREAALQGLTPAVVRRQMSPLELELKQQKRASKKGEGSCRSGSIVGSSKKDTGLTAQLGTQGTIPRKAVQMLNLAQGYVKTLTAEVGGCRALPHNCRLVGRRRIRHPTIVLLPLKKYLCCLNDPG